MCIYLGCLAFFFFFDRHQTARPTLIVSIGDEEALERKELVRPLSPKVFVIEVAALPSSYEFLRSFFSDPSFFAKPISHANRNLLF